MTAWVRVDGVPVGVLYPVSGLKYSTRWIVDAPCGDFEASVTVGCDPNLQDDWTLPGKEFRVYAPGGGLLWGGLTSEPDRGADGVTLHAAGMGAVLKDWIALDRSTDPDERAPTANPNLAVDDAEADGAPFTRAGVNLGTTTLGDEEPFTDIGTLLSRAAVAQGKRVYVDSLGVISYVSDPTTVSWTLAPDTEYMGTADDQFVTRLFGLFTDSSTSLPAVVRSQDNTAANLFGVREKAIDLRPLGEMTEPNASAYIAGRFTLVGARMGWTEGVTLHHNNLFHISGAYAPARYVRAGEMIQIPDNRDSRSTPTARAAIRFVLSQVEITEADRPTAFAAPVGFSPRDFEGALAPPENPALKETA